MLRQFNRFLLLAIIIALALYITLTNPESATIHIGPNISISAYAGVLYIGVFFIGVLAASIVALFFGLKGWFRERKLRAAERSRQAFFDLFIKARNFMANYEWQAARSLWETVISKDPDNIIARVELSLCLESLGDLWIFIHIYLGKHYLTHGRIGRFFENRPEGFARTAPGRPQVDNDRHLV